MKMKEYKIRYKLYSRSRQTRTEKVQAEGRFSAAADIFCKYRKYPIHMVSVYPVGDN